MWQLIGLSSLLIFFAIFTYQHQDIFSLSAGDHYYLRLNYWLKLIQTNRWPQAVKLETKLNSDDIRYYKDQYSPESLQNKLKALYGLENLTVDDWLTIARLELLLDHYAEASAAVERAYQIDPLHREVEKIYFTFPQISR